ncbi:antibiotic biosynthesis monooxygenase family protein [Streptomyces sp. NPDC018833]|uniref:antibiotic biosynthesis monooxygenase family protein n=1 Tax=Streptomyces sp. NPDC018833 TaxID=3365053 RepID=UPI0037A9EB2D
MSIKPVGGIEPPYYAVVFTPVRHDDPQGYAETAVRMDELVRAVPGFLGYESAKAPGGLGITVGHFRDTDSIAARQRDLEHREAQRRGRAEWYESYSVHVAKLERSYGFERG